MNCDILGVDGHGSHPLRVDMKPQPRPPAERLTALAEAFRENAVGLFVAEPSRIRALDGIRALSILLVMTGHLWFVFSMKGLVDATSPFWSLEHFPTELGVDVFFTLSGFLIGTIVFRGLERRTFSLWVFYKRRFLRLAPAYYLTLSALLALDASPILGTGRRTYALNFLYINNVLPALQQFMTWSWSLAIEEQFYWLFPILAMGVLRFGARAVPWASALWVGAGTLWMFVLLVHYDIPVLGDRSADVGRYGNVVYTSTMYRSAGIACGLLVAALQVFGRNRRLPSFALPAAVAVGLALFAPGSLAGPRNTVVYLGLRHVVMSVCVAVVLLGLGAGRIAVLSRLLEGRVFVPVAKLSYSLYLLHPIVYLKMAEAFRACGLAVTNFNVGALMLASVLASHLGAAAMYLLVEKPIMDLRGPAVST